MSVSKYYILKEHTHDHVKISRQQPVFKDAPIRDIDPLSLIRNDDDSSAKSDVTPKVNVTSYRQMIKLENLGDLLEPLLELLNLHIKDTICQYTRIRRVKKLTFLK